MSATLAPPPLPASVRRLAWGATHGTAYGLEEPPPPGAPCMDGGRLRLPPGPDVWKGVVNMSAERAGRAWPVRSYADEMVCGRWSLDAGNVALEKLRPAAMWTNVDSVDSAASVCQSPAC